MAYRKLIFLLAAAAVFSLNAVAQNAAVTINVDANANKHPISPYIYGVSFGTTSDLSTLNATANRYGGNSSTRYNWQQNADNRGSDWYFESYPDDSATPGGRGDDFITNTRAAGVGAEPLITIPMINYVGKVDGNRNSLRSFSVAKYGAQQATDPWNSDAGNGVHTNGTNITGNDPTDASTANSVAMQQGWVQHIISRWGTAANGGLKYYVMDNEPSIWHGTHRDVHPMGATYSEMYNDYLGYAGAIRAADPNALIVGPEEWGWLGEIFSGYDQQNGAGGSGSDYNTHGQTYFYPWFLQQLHAYQQSSGKQLLNVLSVHFYPQDGSFDNGDSPNAQSIRNQTTRSLWDPNYVDQSWIASVGVNGGKINLIPQLKSWIAQYYPGLKTAITEYNLGDEANLNGATAQADAVGIFGREGLDMATRWTVPASNTPTFTAMQIYRNYDGNKSTFGDTSVSATAPNVDKLSAFAAIRTSDGALTVMVINKQTGSTPVTLNIANFTAGATAGVWQISSATSPAINHLSSIAISNNTVNATVPSQSVTLFVIPAGTAITPPAAPTGLNATASSSQINLTWTASSGAASYNVYRGVAAGAESATPLVTGITTATYADTAVTNGTTYYYKVGAVNNGGTSGLSNEASATPQLTAPPAPTGLQATASAGQVSLTWNASAAATGYFVYRGTSSGGESATAIAGPLSATSYNDTAVANGTKYYYKVAATNGGGASALSNEASATPQVSAPAAPTGLTATAGNSQVSLSWTASTGATSYNVYRGTSAGAENATPLATGVASASYADNSVANGAKYFYKVAAVNAGGASGLSNEASATPQVGAPAPPTALIAAGGDSSVTISWTGSASATWYTVYRGTSAGAESNFALVNGIVNTQYVDASAQNGTTYFYKVVAANAGGTSGFSNEASATPSPSTSGLRFVPLTPCRIADTRNAAGPFGGPSIPGGTSRDFVTANSACGIPSNAAALSLNVTVVPHGALAYLTLFPTGHAAPFVSTLNSLDGRIKANAAIVPTGTNASVSVYVTNTTDVVMDVNGYFVTPALNTLAFYAVPPCRIADTRLAVGPFGGPTLQGGNSRTFAVPLSSCNMPQNASAYSLNFTAVPQGALGYLSTWPTGRPMPLVSTLNSPTAAIVANAAIVPAGTGGAISVYATNPTDVVIDVNGYFAPPGNPGALSFVPVAPCRISDTRNAAGTFGGPFLGAGQSRTYPIQSSSCAIPASAKAFSLNATVVPAGALAYLTLWPSGKAQPFVSTLNALDGSITSNAAIVPAASDGGINAYVTNSTDLVLDVNGYFAP